MLAEPAGHAQDAEEVEMLELAREVDVMRKDGSRLLSKLRMARESISHVTVVQVGRVSH